MYCKSIVFLIIAILMFCANVGMSQTEWEKYAGNPVLDLGASGTWEDVHVAEPTVLYMDGIYKMWYFGQATSLRCGIGYATGTDSISWTKHPNNPVLNFGTSGTWDDERVVDPSVLYKDGTYKMWYAGYDGSNYRIGYATSTDGINWTKHPTYVLDLGASGTWEDEHVYSPTVLHNGIEYEMWYTGHDGSIARIGYATSTDGINWTKHLNNPVLDLGTSGTWEDDSVLNPTVLYDGIEYKMWYSGHNLPNSRIGYATSIDGINWTKYPNNPVLDLGGSGTWEDLSVQMPFVLYDGGAYEMWYTGNDSPHLRIGYATSIPDTGSINGTVTDMVGNPLRALVSVINIKWTLTNPDDGYYEIMDLESGEYLVLAIKRGYRAGFARVTVEAGKTTTQDFKLRPKSGEEGEDEFPALSNFPNPFNPDTWIPYYLPQDTDVTIQIYNSAGQLVRILNMGNQAAGVYLDKEQAAYWDGRDNFGQKVSSGVYYYTLQAGDFNATRKMVIVK